MTWLLFITIVVGVQSGQINGGMPLASFSTQVSCQQAGFQVAEVLHPELPQGTGVYFLCHPIPELRG